MNASSYHSLTPKAMLSTVAHRDKTFYDQNSLHWLWNCNTRACSDRLTTATRCLQVLKSPAGVTSHTENPTLLAFDMIHLITAIGLAPSGSNTIHIYRQTIHRTTQLKTLVGRLSGIRTPSGQTKWEECGPCPIFVSYTLAFALKLRKKHG